MRPHGVIGVIVGKIMDLMNRRACQYAQRRLHGDAVLEIGFGTGQLVRFLNEEGTHRYVAGVDPSPLMLKTARKRNRRPVERGEVDLRLGDASSLPWRDACFDSVAAVHSFQFWNDPLHDLREVRRVLRPGGQLLLILRAHNPDRRVDWLPNPLSRGANEIAETCVALRQCGFSDVAAEGKVGSSAVVVARRA
jgi:ubiquinone/menaquinone biosynthesis C-methylase UbiE